jgi:Fe-S cluster assembly protein SufD
MKPGEESFEFMVRAAEEKDIYLSAFADFERKQAGQSDVWLHPIRQAASTHFAELGFPTTRDEAWRFTNVAPLAKTPFQRSSLPVKELGADVIEQLCRCSWARHRLVFVNGRLAQDDSATESLPEGVVITGLSDALKSRRELVEPHLTRHADYEAHPFVALNTAFIEDGAFIYLPKNVVIEGPILMLFISTGDPQPTVSHPRNLIIADANSQARIVESYIGLEGASYLTNAVTEIVLGENAVVNHCKLQQESLEGFHVATLQVHQERSAAFSDFSVSVGGALVRNDVGVKLDGDGAECALDGFYIARGRQHVDNHTRIEHAKPHGTSREFYKGILDEHARAVFDGTIVVRPGAQKTDAKQTNKNLLLSTDALVNTNPRLEIFADDVKCSHGATIGQLDADALFYLRSRGIDLETARHLLTYAFATDILGRIKVEAIRTELECMLLLRLPQGDEVMEGL